MGSTSTCASVARSRTMWSTSARARKRMRLTSTQALTERTRAQHQQHGRHPASTSVSARGSSARCP
jgi:hypothetical protein